MFYHTIIFFLNYTIRYKMPLKMRTDEVITLYITNKT